MSAVFDARLACASDFRKHGTTRGAGLAITVALHAVAIAGILSYAPAREALRVAAPIMVEFIAPPKVAQVRPVRPEPAKPVPMPPKARPIAKQVERAVETLPVIATPVETPSPMTVSTPPAQQLKPEPVRAAPPIAASAPAPTVAPATPMSVSQPVFNADYLDNPAPAYPPLSRRNNERGRVLLRVMVNAKGAADEIQVHTSSGFTRLDEAARNTVQRWKFVPARRGNDPVAAWVLIPISFRLES